MATIAVVQRNTAHAGCGPGLDIHDFTLSRLISNSGGLRIRKSFLGQHLTLKCGQVPHGRARVLLAPVSALNGRGRDGDSIAETKAEVERSKGSALKQYQDELAARIRSKEFTSESQMLILRNLRSFLVKFGGAGRAFAKSIAVAERKWRIEKSYQMPEATGDIRAVIGEPFFVPLYNLFLACGGVFRLKFGPKIRIL